MTIELAWETDTDPADTIGYAVGYTMGATNVTLTGVFRDEPNIVIDLTALTRQLYRFWIAPTDAAGNMGKKRYLLNAYKP